MSNSLAWEVIHGAYVYRQLDTGLKQELLDNFSVQPTDISAIDAILSSNLVLKPFYGKLAVFNRRVIHLDVSIPFGVAGALYTNPRAYLLGPDAGLIVRVYASPHVSFCVDVRHHVFFSKWAMRNELHVSLGAAFAWGGDER